MLLGSVSIVYVPVIVRGVASRNPVLPTVTVPISIPFGLKILRAVLVIDELVILTAARCPAVPSKSVIPILFAVDRVTVLLSPPDMRPVTATSEAV